MGVYVYTLRTETKELLDGRVVGYYKYSSRASDISHWSPVGHAVARAERAQSLWRGRKKPDLVVVRFDDAKGFQDGDMVFEGHIDGRPMDALWYDCDQLGKFVGWLSRERVGRRVVWGVVPLRWEVTCYKMVGDMKRIYRREESFDRGALERVVAQVEDPEMCISVVRISCREGKEVRETVFLREPEDVRITREIRERATAAGLPWREIRGVMKSTSADEGMDPGLLQRAQEFQRAVAEL